MFDLQASIRTAVQAVAGWVVYQMLQRFGVTVDAAALEVVLYGAATGFATLVLRWLETRFPWLSRIISLGTTKSGPVYVE